MNDKIWLKSMDMFQMSCHQKPERSFYYKSYQYPVCARCTGLYLGYLIGLIIGLLFNPSIIVAIIMIIPCGLDGFIQLKTNYESTNIRRFILGIIAGIGYLIIIVEIIQLIITKIF